MTTPLERLTVTRRRLLALAGSGALLASFPACGYGGMVAGDSFDDALDALHLTDPEFGGGLSNHGPMAMEALVALGRADRVVPWVDGYLDRVQPLTLPAPLPLTARASSLGRTDLRGEWIASYLEELASTPALELFVRDFPALVRGYAGAGLHGLLRTAHGLRSLARSDTPSRRRELAHALGYWSAGHLTLPGEPGARRRAGYDVTLALADLQPVPSRVETGLIIERLSTIDDAPGFVDVVEAVDLDAIPIDRAITELTSAAARIFVGAGGLDIAHLHALTGASALRSMLPVLDAASQRLGLAHAFQTVAALHVTTATMAGIPASTPPSEVTREALAVRAGSSNDEHTIKLLEAALREHAIDPRPEFLAAADLWSS